MVTKTERLIYEMVLERDRVMFWEASRERVKRQVGTVRGTLSLAEFLINEPTVCAAPLMDPYAWGTCSGEMERDHVHTHTGGTKSKRPPTTMETLVILCHHHHQDGWATSHRPEIRTYIKEANERWRTIRS